MTITINGDDIDFTLEDEKTIGDVLTEIKTWLGSTGMLVGDIEIDNRKMTLEEKCLSEKPLEEVGQLSIEALSIRESRIRQLEIARDFFALLKDTTEAGDNEALGELESSYRELRTILPQLLGEKPNSSILSELEGTPKQESREQVTTAMLGILDKRLKEATNPIGEAKFATVKLTQLAKGLDEVAVNLQTGKNKQAMNAIDELCEILQKFVRCLAWGAGSVGMDNIVEDINKLLSELETALIANDTVLIGDLLEYELKPLLMELPSRMRFDLKPTR